MFSGTIKINNIDDYIQPSKECVKPLQVGKKIKIDELPDDSNQVVLKN